MEQKLTAQERADLQIWHKKERDKRACDRIKSVLAYDDGYSYPEIARLLLDNATIRRHIDDYFSKRKLKPENGGSQSQLQDAFIEHYKSLKESLAKDEIIYFNDRLSKAS